MVDDVLCDEALGPSDFSAASYRACSSLSVRSIVALISTLSSSSSSTRSTFPFSHMSKKTKLWFTIQLNAVCTFAGRKYAELLDVVPVRRKFVTSRASGCRGSCSAKCGTSFTTANVGRLSPQLPSVRAAVEILR